MPQIAWLRPGRAFTLSLWMVKVVERWSPSFVRKKKNGAVVHWSCLCKFRVATDPEDSKQVCLYSVRIAVSSQCLQSDCMHSALKAEHDHNSEKASSRDKLINQGQFCLCSSSTRMAPAILSPHIACCFVFFLLLALQPYSK